MNFHFYKYHGTGNDFILADNRNGKFSGLTTEQVAALCHRRFGIGADGLILLSPFPGKDFFMDYFNSDGKRSSMCGNGGRCISLFAKKLGIAVDQVIFQAVDGPHQAVFTKEGVKLKMGIPTGFEKINETDFWIHTGSPHYVRFVSTQLELLDVKKEGAKIRFAERWAKEGTNVNFVHKLPDGKLFVRTYERGVEDETWSCGTGVTAVAEIAMRLQFVNSSPVKILTPGGDLLVHIDSENEPWLEGNATLVFEGDRQI